MSTYLLPNINIPNIYDNIKPIFTEEDINGIINKNLNFYLNNIKIQIDKHIFYIQNSIRNRFCSKKYPSKSGH